MDSFEELKAKVREKFENDENARLADAPMAPGQSVTVKDLDDLNKTIFEQRELIAQMEELVKAQNKILAQLEGKAVAYLKELGREKYQSPYGTISVAERWTWKQPQTPEQREAFFNYLRDKGVFDNMISVHAQTLNSFCNSEWDEAKKAGAGFDFRVPGLPEPSLFERLHVLRARNKE